MLHLAHLNIAKLIAPIDDPLIADFKNGIEIINTLAEKSAGFIWRLKDEDQKHINSPYHILNDDMIIYTLSVWEDFKSLKAFTYHSEHGKYLQRKKEWFHKMASNNYVLWYIDRGHVPTLAKGLARLKYLNNKGECSKAFTFKTAHLWHTAIQE